MNRSPLRHSTSIENSTVPLMNQNHAGRTRRGRPTPEASERNMSLLMDIGLRHFLQYGEKGANILAIAEEAGVTRQMIYNHFGDKNGFFQAVTHKRETRIIKEWLFDIEHDEREARVVLQQWVELALTYMLGTERITLGRSQLGGLHAFPDLAKEEWNANKRTHAAIAKFLAHAAEKGGVTLLMDPLRAAVNFGSLLLGIQYPVLLGAQPAPSRAKQKQLATEITTLFLRGIGFRID